MKLLKFDRKSFEKRFGSKSDCYAYLAKLKFDIDKAFGMLYEIATSKKGASSIRLAERFGVQQNTAWLFRQKV